jgi:hypothetical protein
MLDREKVEAILMRRFPGAAAGAIAAAANGIMGLEDEWEEIGAARESRAHDGEIRVFRRRLAHARFSSQPRAE